MNEISNASAHSPRPALLDRAGLLPIDIAEMALDVREIGIGEHARDNAVAELLIVPAGHCGKPASAGPGLIVASQDPVLGERRIEIELPVAEAAAEIEPGPAIGKRRSRWRLNWHVGGKRATAGYQSPD